MSDPVEAAWAALRSHLEIHSRELYEQVRTYPTPIARCDIQLTRAIEERDAAFRRLWRADELDVLRTQLGRDAWCAALREFVADAGLSGDQAAVAAREGLLVALAR
jgi:hypothetical protein